MSGRELLTLTGPAAGEERDVDRRGGVDRPMRRRDVTCKPNGSRSMVWVRLHLDTAPSVGLGNSWGN
jgi:hypothetical protein